ncbi:MAG: hypothetical protein J5903_03660, partial [Clostridia bacterium]|nr:hypothetical protein [Clostridia bacterium]
LKNAVLHALSGGPVYISDKTGRTVPELLYRLCDKNGKLIRAEGMLVPVKECLFSDAEKEKMPITLYNIKNGSVAVTAFNICSGESVSLKIDLSQFGFNEEELFVYDVFEKTARKYRSDGTFRIKLENAEQIGLYILSEIKNGFAVIGDTEKFLCPYNVRGTDGNTVFISEGVCVFDSENELHIKGAEKVVKKAVCISARRLKTQNLKYIPNNGSNVKRYGY